MNESKRIFFKNAVTVLVSILMVKKRKWKKNEVAPREKKTDRKGDCENIMVTNDLPHSLYTCCKSYCCGGRLGTVAVITSKPQWGVETFLLSCVSEMDGHFFYKQPVTERVDNYSFPISH